jgi:hypothetical protein
MVSEQQYPDLEAHMPHGSEGLSGRWLEILCNDVGLSLLFTHQSIAEVRIGFDRNDDVLY